MDVPSRIAVTLGDPAGIGPEIIVKAFQKQPALLKQTVVVGDGATLAAAASRWAPELAIRIIDSLNQVRSDDSALSLLDLKNIPTGFISGQARAACGQASFEYIEKAVQLAMDNEVAGITTAPINKESLHLAGHPFPGHTELLAELTNTGKSVLMLAGRRLRVVLVTTHVPLSGVHALITQDSVLATLRITDRWLRRYVCEAPNIAVTGLNPHSGDGGIFGSEEATAIVPALQQAVQEGLLVDGPYSADALFANRRFEKYNAVVAMYHDQGMIPVKMESMGSAVNITLGLPILRTSVDHGTAYDIAGMGKASPDSMIHALETAKQLVGHPIEAER